MNWLLYIAVCCWLQVGDNAQPNASNDHYEFRNDGFGKIVNLPSDESVYAEIRIASFSPARGLELEPMGDKAFEIIEKMPNLEQLYINCLTDPLTERTARLIASRRKLKVLIVYNAVVTREAISLILSIPLECLAIRCVPVADQLQLLETRNLRNLTLRHCGLQNSSAGAIANCPKLKYLDVHDNEYIDTGFIRQLNSLQELEALKLTGANLTLGDCRHIIEEFPSLKWLTAESNPEGERLLQSRLSDFQLLPSYSGGGNPLWGIEEKPTASEK